MKPDPLRLTWVKWDKKKKGAQTFDIKASAINIVSSFSVKKKHCVKLHTKSRNMIAAAIWKERNHIASRKGNTYVEFYPKTTGNQLSILMICLLKISRSIMPDGIPSAGKQISFLLKIKLSAIYILLSARSSRCNACLANCTGKDMANCPKLQVAVLSWAKLSMVM
jgi:hypothetical protein